MKYDIIVKKVDTLDQALESFFEMKYDIIFHNSFHSTYQLESFFEMKYDIITLRPLISI